MPYWNMIEKIEILKHGEGDNLDGLGVNTENGLATINSVVYGLKDILTKHHSLLTTLVLLSTSNQARDAPEHSVYNLLKR